jgi:signal transduction histidine kinase
VRKLHLKFYLAIVVTLMMFLAAGGLVWHHLSSPLAALSGVESATGFAATLLAEDGNTQRTTEVITALAQRLHADVAYYDTANVLVYSSGNIPAMTPTELSDWGWHMRPGGPVLVWQFNDGRHLTVHPHHKFLLHSLHMLALLTGIAVMLALLTYPITRGITARLARLQTGVLAFGAGDLTSRVKVEGRDEVATLARSFNDSAERIEQLVRAHQLLLANCSHELRTPLARIRLAVDRVPGTEPAVTAELSRNIAELDALIGEMLLSSRLAASSGIDRTEPVDLLALVAEEAAHFDLEVSGDHVTLIGDAMLLRRLVRNLLDNAKVHGGGATLVRIERHAGHVHLRVEDAGAGVNAADHEKIFEPFYRASAATRSSGAGLGLAIVRQIARAHGGDVKYMLREAGGSRFIVTLPG